MLSVREDQVTEEVLETICHFLKQGGVIAHASDTCYGLMADASNESAVKKVHRIKGSSEEKPMSIFLSSIEQIREFAQVSSEAEEFMHQNMPGPFTIILPKQQNFGYQQYNPTIGIRVPMHSFTRRLVDYYGTPLTTTSANRASHPPTYSGKQVEEAFKSQPYRPDLIVDFGTIPPNSPSRIIDFSAGEPRWIR